MCLMETFKMPFYLLFFSRLNSLVALYLKVKKSYLMKGIRRGIYKIGIALFINIPHLITPLGKFLIPPMMV